MSTAPLKTLTEDSKLFLTDTGADWTAETRATSCSSLKSSTTKASKTCVASSALMVDNASGLVAKATATSGLTIGGTTTGGSVVVVVVVEVVDVLVEVVGMVTVVVVSTGNGGTVV